MSFSFDIYVIQAIHGLVYGMLLFLVASGLTLVFGMMGVLNLAHAGFYMLRSYFAYSVAAWTGNFWVSLCVAPLGAAIAGSSWNASSFARSMLTVTPMNSSLLLVFSL